MKPARAKQYLSLFESVNEARYWDRTKNKVKALHYLNKALGLLSGIREGVEDTLQQRKEKGLPYGER